MSKQITFLKLLAELRQCCQMKLTGRLFIIGENHVQAQISLNNGEIVSLSCQNRPGEDALPLIAKMNNCWCQFIPGHVVAQSNTPPTAKVLAFLAGQATQRAAHAALAESLPVTGKILVVEDSTTVRKMIVKILAQHGYATIEAENGISALAQLNNEKPDLILLDIIMPGMDGYKVLSIIKQHVAFKAIPVIMMTSKDNLLEKLQTLRMRLFGSIEYMTKPFAPTELLARIDKQLHPICPLTAAQV